MHKLLILFLLFSPYCLCMNEETNKKSETITIRTIQIKDAEQIETLMAQYDHPVPKEYIEKMIPLFHKHETIAALMNKHKIEASKELVEEIISIVGDDIAFVATDNDKVVGHAFFHTRPIFRYGYLESLVVLKEYRRKGIATKLLEKVEEYTKENGMTHLEFICSNKRKEEAHQFYIKHNYNDNDKAYFQKKLAE